MKNLLICHTPLQCLIAQHLCQLFPDQTFDFIMFGYVHNPKINHYFQNTAALCQHSEWILINPSQTIHYLKQLHQLAHKTDHYQSVFVASIDTSIVHALLSGIQYQQLFTFDDGLANIITGSVLRQTKHYSFINRIIRHLCGIRTNLHKLTQSSQGHYTLYPNHDNITQPLIPVSLFHYTTPTTKAKSTIRILLGQPFLPSEQDNIDFFNHLIQKFHIDYYFPHPREQYKISHATYLHTELIIEDYLFQIIKENPSQYIELYTLFSSAALNLKDLPNIHIQAIRPNHPFFQQPHIATLYHLMEQSGLTIISASQ